MHFLLRSDHQSYLFLQNCDNFGFCFDWCLLSRCWYLRNWILSLWWLLVCLLMVLMVQQCLHLICFQFGMRWLASLLRPHGIIRLAHRNKNHISESNLCELYFLSPNFSSIIVSRPDKSVNSKKRSKVMTSFWHILDLHEWGHQGFVAFHIHFRKDVRGSFRL